MLKKIIHWTTCNQDANAKPANHVAEMSSVCVVFARGGWRWNSQGCALGIGECGRHGGMSSAKYSPAQWQGGSPNLLPKSLWVKLSHEAQISSAYFSGIKGPVLYSDCVGKKKNINHSNKFSAGIEVFFQFYKINMGKFKAVPIKFTPFQICHPRNVTPRILKEINGEFFSLLARIFQCNELFHYINLQH